MPTTFDKSNNYTHLREKAEAHLQAGTTPSTGRWSIAADALSLLHRLSGNPDTSEDALKLLHELQVHQVELDLQNEEIAAHERVLAEDLRLYRSLFECAPVAYCVVDSDAAVILANLAAAGLFGVEQESLEGQSIDTFVNPQNRPLLISLLQRVLRSSASGACIAEMAGSAQPPRYVRFQASPAPQSKHILLACYECANAQ